MNELETAIDGMQTTFLELHDSAMNCLSKNPEIAAVGFGSNLKDLTEKFLGLAKGALGSSEGAESGDEDAEGESINEEENGNARSKRRRSRDDGSPGSGGMQGSGGGGGSVPSFGGYQVSYSRENGNSRGSRSSYDNSGSQNRSAGDGSGRNNTMTTNSPLSSNFHRDHDLFSPSPSEGGYAGGALRSSPTIHSASAQYKQHIPTGLDAFSYSFHETNFSRRLHRAGLEHAYQMLSSPDADQYEVARIFAYTFCYVSKEDALKTVSTLLQGGSKESLDIFDHPELLQLPRKPVDYTNMVRKYENDKANRASTESGDKDAFDLKEEASKMLIKLGIHQKYLRPDEVEKYITDLGILTTTDTSVVDTDLMDMDVRPGSSLQKPQTPVPPAVLTPRSPPATPTRSSPRSDQATTGQQGGLTSATVMSFEYQSPFAASEDQIKYQLAHFEDDHTPPATLDEVNTTSSTKVLEGVKGYVDLDMFVKRMYPSYLQRRTAC